MFAFNGAVGKEARGVAISSTESIPETKVLPVVVDEISVMNIVTGRTVNDMICKDRGTVMYGNGPHVDSSEKKDV